MSDALAILRTIAEYCHAVDEHGGEGLAELFTEDGELDFMGERIRGRAAIAERLSNTGAGSTGLVHVAYNPIIEIDGDTAAGTVDHMLLRRGADGGFSIFLVGRWVDEYVRDGNHWRITRRRIDLPFGPPPGSVP